MGNNADNTVKLQSLDAAIVFRENSEIELILNEEEHPVIPENIRWALAVMYALKNDGLSTLIEQHFNKECLRLKLQLKVEEEHAEFSDSFSIIKKEAGIENSSNLVDFSTFQKAKQ